MVINLLKDVQKAITFLSFPCAKDLVKDKRPTSEKDCNNVCSTFTTPAINHKVKLVCAINSISFLLLTGLCSPSNEKPRNLLHIFGKEGKRKCWKK